MSSDRPTVADVLPVEPDDTVWIGQQLHIERCKGLKRAHDPNETTAKTVPAGWHDVCNYCHPDRTVQDEYDAYEGVWPA